MIINGKSITLIAEVKTISPSGYVAREKWDDLFQIANDIGDIISIHTDHRWGGSFDLISKARQLTKKPILAKGLHFYDDEVEKAFSLGADYVLVVGRVPSKISESRQQNILIEPYDLLQLRNIPERFKIVWNSRDLVKSLIDGREIDRDQNQSFEDARKIRPGWMCQASNIRNIDDVNLKADAILVGTHLKEFAKSIKNKS